MDTAPKQNQGSLSVWRSQGNKGTHHKGTTYGYRALQSPNQHHKFYKFGVIKNVKPSLTPGI